MESSHYWDQIAIGKVVSTIENFSAGKYQNLSCPNPSLAEQSSIADYLDRETARIDALITKKQRMIAVVGERVGSLIHERVGSIPTSRRLRQLASLGTGHTPDRRNSEYWENCSIAWVTAEDLSSRDNPFEALMDTRQKVSALGVANSAAVVHPAGTVMLCRTASIGLICRVGMPMATTQAFVTWSPGPELDSEFLMYALHSLRQEWTRLAFGSTHDTIYMPDLESVKIPYVPIRAQREIARELEASTKQLLMAKQQLDRQCELLRERRQALITAAVTGELDVAGVAA
jgi:type I restriction enzyme S subunit